jgi:ABC-type transport system substrate-binding protein
MEPKDFKEVMKGVSLGLLIVLMLFSSLLTVPATNAAQTSPLFSITLICSTTNPVRRQHAALIANAMQSVGIDARVVYMAFADLIGRLFPDKSMIGKTFADGGYDIGFLGYGMTSPIPDIKNQYYGSKEAFPPDGNNYALYNTTEANTLLNQIYSQLDPVKQLDLFKKFSLVINRDKPYENIYLTLDVIARKPEIKLFGDSQVFSSMCSYFNDIQYMSGVTSLTFAEAGNWQSLAPWTNTQSNSFYSLFVYGATQGGLQLVDPRTNTMYLNEAQSITPSTDGRTWTIKIKPGILYHDGVEATADDYLFAEMAGATPSVASLTLSDKIARFGGLIEFDYLDGKKVLVDNSDGKLTTPTTVFKALDKYTYTFTIGPSVDLYAFLGQTECAIAPLPKHYLEQIPFANWNQLPYATGLAGAYTYTWNTTKYGGSGTYTAYGPVGTGPYVYKGYDPVKQLATLEKFNNYFDKARLEALGYFTVQKYYVVTIVEKDAAIAAYRTGDVDALDVNYQVAGDMDVLKSLGANVFLGGVNGWQEMGFNLQHPITGTGLGTPAGKADPKKAA